jgi:Mrp family chromosome partitioning ATPase
MRTRSLDKLTSATHAHAPVSSVPPELAPYCQALVNRLGLASGAIEAPQVVGFTSCARGAGVSTVAGALAAFAAGGGQQVLLIDAHWQHPAQARRFGLLPGPGLWDVLAGEVEANMAIAATPCDNLCLLPSGRRPADGLLLSGRPLLAGNLKQWKERFDLIVLDLPPALPEEPLIAWTGILDGVVFVVEAERTTAPVARQARQALVDCEARLLGAVLNKQRSHLPGWLS